MAGTVNKKNILISSGWYLYYDGSQYRVINSTADGDVDCGSARTIQSALNLYLDERAIRGYIGGTSNVAFATAFAARNALAESLASDASGRIGCRYQPVLWGEGL